MKQPCKLISGKRNYLSPLPSGGKLYNKLITRNKRLLPNLLTDDIKYEIEDLKQSQKQLMNNFIFKQRTINEPIDRVYLTNSLKRTPNKGNISICENCQNITMTNNKAEINSLKEWLEKILKEIEVLTTKVKQDIDEDDKRLNWKFAAMVVDRLCMILFAIFTFTSTFTFSLNMFFVFE